MTEEFPKIWPPYEVFYLHSMLFNSMSAMRSVDRLNSIFEKLPQEPSIDDVKKIPTKLVLNELQNLIGQAGALSRYFWPPQKNKKHEARGQALREAFSINEVSPLCKRDLRNAMEHFDERLDDHVANGIVGYIFPEFVGPRPLSDGVPGHFFRAYFVDEGIFVLLNEEFPIQPIVDELIFVHTNLVKMDQQGGRLRKVKREEST